MTEECGQIINSSACLCSLNVENKDNHRDKLLGAYKVEGSKDRSEGHFKEAPSTTLSTLSFNTPPSASQHCNEHACILFIYSVHRLGSETCICQFISADGTQSQGNGKPKTLPLFTPVPYPISPFEILHYHSLFP